MRAHWEQERAAIARIRELKEQIEQARLELEPAEREVDLEGAARLGFGTLPELEGALEAANADLERIQAERRMLKEEVDEEDVAEVVSAWTRIPVSRLLEGELQKLLHMEERAGRFVSELSGGMQQRVGLAPSPPTPTSF